MQFQISCRRENIGVLRSDAEENNSGPLNRAGILDLPLLRTLVIICQKSREPSFWEVINPFDFIAYASSAASRTLLQLLLAFLNFTLDSEDCSVGANKKCNFYELWQQHKQLKTMEMSEV